MEYTYNFCDRTFETDQGREVQAGEMHKEEVKKDNLVTCDMCDWSGCSKDMLKCHIQGKHKEQLRRKIIKEQQIKYYICDFQSSSEIALQIHTEERHNQKYSIQKDNSMTKSPPTKKVKEHNYIDMDTDSFDVVKQKNADIRDLKSTINLLIQKLLCFEGNLNKNN